MSATKSRKMKAWLVTWEWIGDHAKRDEKVAAVFNPRFSGERVRELVEALYVAENSSLREKLTWAKDRTSNPYPAEFERINGVRWEGRIHCGHNPNLYARLVDDLTVEVDKDGIDKATWKERSMPKMGGGSH
jgi:hypothetical protein